MKYLIIFLVTLLSAPLFSKDITLLVLLRKSVDEVKYKGLKDAVQASEWERFDNFNSDYFKRLYRVVLPGENESLLLKSSLVESIEKIYEIDPEMSLKPGRDSTVSNDHFIDYQWGVFSSGQSITRDIDDINNEAVQAQTGVDIQIKEIFGKIEEKIKDDVLVAVIDSGIDFDHPDLVANIYRNKIECNEDLGFRVKPTDDLDGNGYIGDCMGWDFTAKTNPHRPSDGKGHGTHVAGIIAATKNNNLGVSGLSNKIKILPVKVLKEKEVASEEMGTFTDRVAKGILYAVKMKAQIINLSLGWPRAIDTRYLRESINAALEQGIFVVAAAGNNNTNVPIYPCSYMNVFCVGALAADDMVARFSNYGGSVDVVAPGEQILSTYPTKLHPQLFSTNGYEVKDGSSQAAPFVAAQAAIIKGVYPSATADELWARIVETTRPIKVSPSTLKQAQNGLIQIKRSLEINQKDVIRPIFKEINGIVFDRSQKTFTFELLIKNYWEENENVSIDIRLDNPSVINTTYHYKGQSFKRGESKKLKLVGELGDLNRHSNVIINVMIKSGEKSSTYRYETPLVGKLDKNDDDVMETKIVSAIPIDKLIIEKDGKIYSRIKTVLDHYKQDLFPHYYYSELKDGKMTLTIFSKVGSDLISKNIDLPFVQEIITITRMDLNYDNKLDYLISAVGKNSTGKILQYIYLNSDLQEVAPGTSFYFRPEMKDVFFNTVKSTFIPYTWKGHTIAIPIWADYGQIPALSQNPDPFVKPDQSVNRHVYMLIPTDKIEESLHEMRMRILDDYKFQETIRKQFNLFWSDKIKILGSYTQSKKLLEDGISNFQLTIGESYLRKYYRVKVSQEIAWDITEIDVNGISLEGSYKTPVHQIHDQMTSYQEHTAFIGFQTDTLAQYALFNNESFTMDYFYRYEQMRKSDHLLGAMISFVKGDRLYSFLQSKSNVVMITKQNEQMDVFFHPINRVSFISDNVFNEMYYPVVYGTGANKYPAYYIDATTLHSGHVYVIKASEEGLISPIKNNVFIPDNCTPMNPVRIESDLEAYSILCKEEGEVVMKYIPIM